MSSLLSNVKYFSLPNALPNQGISLIRFQGNKSLKFHEVHQAETTDHGCQNYSNFSSRMKPDAYLQEVLSKQCPPEQGVVVELGCNRGNNLVPLAQKGYSIFGIDIEKGVLNDLKKYVLGKPFQDQVTVAQWDFGEAGDLPWQGEKTPLNPKGVNLLGKVQAFYSVHVLSHFSAAGLEKTIQGLKRFLAPGGLFMATILQKSGPEFLSCLSPEQRKQNGYVEHSPEEIQQAFTGLEETQFSRPFKPGELDKWKLPEEKIHWRVFRKPV